MSEILVPASSNGILSQFGLEYVSSRPFRIRQQSPNDPVIIRTTSRRDVLRATDLDDTRSYRISGLQDNDQLSGAAGKDQLFGGTGDDILQGNDADDILSGDKGQDLLQGGDGDDVLRGGRDVDRLEGGAGDDELSGNHGRDVLIGGEGKDRFMVNGRGDMGRPNFDQVLDFNPSEDTIEISRSAIPKAKLSRGLLKEDDFQVVQTSQELQQAQAKIVYDQQTGILYYNPGVGGGDIPLIQLNNSLEGSGKTPTLTADNIRIF